MLVKKAKGQKRHLYHFSDMIRTFNYSAWKRMEIDGHKGWLYRIHEKQGVDMPSAIDDVAKNYDNTKFMKGHPQYAPEMKFTYLFMAD